MWFSDFKKTDEVWCSFYGSFNHIGEGKFGMGLLGGVIVSIFPIFDRGGSRPVYKVCTNLSEFFPKIFLRVYIVKCK